MQQLDIIIIGGGPMGIATAIEAKQAGLTHLVLEKGVLVNSLYHFPDQMTFFSTSQRLEIGQVPFMSLNEKPTRHEALEYYRRVVEHFKLNIHTYEPVVGVVKENAVFIVKTEKETYKAKNVVVATGFYATNNQLTAQGSDIAKVSYYYKNAHPYIGKKVAVIGGGNSAAQVALDLFHKGIDVTLIVRKPTVKDSVKYWIKPNLENRINAGEIKAHFNTVVQEVSDNELILNQKGNIFDIANDFVLAMIGYQPDYNFLSNIGVANCNDEYQTPFYDEKQQTNIEGLYLAGVVCGGLKTNRFMIEDSIIHAKYIVQDILEKSNVTR